MTFQINRRGLGLSALAAFALPVAPALARAQNAPSGGAALPLPPAGAPIKVAMLIDNKVTTIDFIGPWEAFQNAGTSDRGFELFMVSPEGGIVETMGGGEFKAKYSLADAPQPNVVVIPAQNGDVRDSPTNVAKLAWLKRVYPKVDVILSVCTGNFIVARSGLLDGLAATTHHGVYDRFEKMFPQVKLQRGRRFVDSGKIVSAGGLTSSIDGALHVISRYFGDAGAMEVAAWMEHDGDGWRTGLR